MVQVCVWLSRPTSLSTCHPVRRAVPTPRYPYRKYAPSATNIWAPDISYWNGTWHVYYAVSEFGKMNSVIGLATASTLNPASPSYGWTDRGPVVTSDGSAGFNAIDPSVVFDADTGVPYMVFGSFWKGIQLVRLNATSGLVDPSFPVTTVAQRTVSAAFAICLASCVLQDPLSRHCPTTLLLSCCRPRARTRLRVPSWRTGPQ